ncbi:glycosyltransferase family 4 protein [Campylobacter sp. 9BO]|uniref:glycosyltransferase family 4 protein n=1 Tax=Campylobacter sp. 9BO TaxID=3424759 RepID=UPI003D3433A7
MAKILELCLSPDLGGLELYMKNATKNLNSTAVIGKNSKLKAAFEAENLAFYEMDRFAVFHLANIIDSQNIDVLHIHWTKDILTAVLAKRLSRKKPKIVQTRHMHMTRFKSDFYHKFLYKNIDMIIAVTELLQEQINKFIPSNIRPKVKVCYLGVKEIAPLDKDKKLELRGSLGIENEFVIGIVGRVEEAKGQHIVLNAAKILRDLNINLRVLVVGGCMDEGYLNALKEKHKDDIFLGHVQNASEYMQICDCVVLATKKETFGLVLAEAMRAGVCVLASDSGGPLEIIDDSKNGLLFEAFNSKELARKLKLVIDDENFRQTLARNGKEKADNKFNEITHFAELVAILNEI